MLSFAPETGWTVERETSWKAPQSTAENVLNRSPNASRVDEHFTEWIDAANVNASGSFSVAALISAPLGKEDGSLVENEYVRLLVPCVFSAYWMPATFCLDPQAAIPVQSNGSIPTNPFAEAVQDVQNGVSPNKALPKPLGLLNIGADWAAGLTDIPALLKDILDPDSDPENYANPPSVRYSPVAAWTFLSTVVPGLTAAFSIGLANFGAGPVMMLCKSKSSSLQDVNSSGSLVLGGPLRISTSTPTTDVYEIGAKVNRYGYAFGARTATSRFGIAIFIYVGVLVIYVVYALWGQPNKHPDTITSFGGTQDITTLAMNSQAPLELVDCGGGVRNRKTWRQLIKVRAHADDNEKANKLELVFQHVPNMVQATAGQKDG